MSARTVRLFVAGLGLLALSCAGMRLPSVPRSAGDIVRSAETVGRGLHDTSECEKLKADIAVSEEYALGGSVAINWVQRGGGLMVSNDAGRKLHHFVNLVGRNLAAQSPRPTLKWTFGVLEDTEAFDAVSAPGGYVFVTRRLLQGVENEAQLAGVLAHEIGHITAKHALARYSEVKVGQCKTAVRIKNGKELVRQSGADFTPASVDALLGALTKDSGLLELDQHPDLLSKLTDAAVDTLVENGFGKEDEFAADELAVRLMVSAGYDPQEYIRFLGKIPDSNGVFSNHPRKADRVKRVVALLAASKKPGDDFPELPAGTAGLAKPPLPAEFSVVKSTVARDKP